MPHYGPPHRLDFQTDDVKDGEAFDVIVIGGGINGAGILRDLSRRGLRGCLVESHELGMGTSSASSMLAHGGLRYLEHFELGLVHEALQDRERMFRDAPHLVRPLHFVYPLYPEIANRRTVRYGLMLYDLLSHGKSVPNRDRLSAEVLLEADPYLQPKGLAGGATFYDGQWLSVERHVIELCLDAQDHGGRVLEGVPVSKLLIETETQPGGRKERACHGVELADGRKLRATVVVNAAGPWVDDLLGEVRAGKPALIRGTKGAHILVKSFTKQAYILKLKDGRTFFVLPWKRYTLLGTTDTDFRGDPRDVTCTDEDIAYLQDATRQFFPNAPVDKVLGSYAGVRPLVNQEGLKEGAVTRRHILFDHGKKDGVQGLISIQGGKLTTYRTLSEHVAVKVCHLLGRKKLARRHVTRNAPLPGCPAIEWEEFRERAVETAHIDYGLKRKDAEAWVDLYGARYQIALQLRARDE